MSFKEKVKQSYAEYKSSRAERKVFRKIVAKRELQARRESYEKEAVRQAAIKGRQLAEAKANKPTFSQRAASFSQRASAFAGAAKVQRTAPTRTISARATPVTRKVRKRRTKKSVKRRRPKQRVVKQSVAPRDPFAPTMNWRF